MAELTQPDPLVEFWVVTYKKYGLLPSIIDGLRKTRIPYHIVIWDNDGKYPCQPAPDLTVIASDENKMCFGASQAMLDHRFTPAPYIAYVCSVHSYINDPAWVEKCIAALDSHPKAGMAGHMSPHCGLNWYQAQFGTERYRAMGKTPLPHDIPLYHHFSREHVFGVPTQQHIQGGVWVAKREVLEAIGGFDHLSFPHYFGDVELCLRMQCHGYRLMDVPEMISAYSPAQHIPDPSKYAFAHHYHGAPA